MVLKSQLRGSGASKLVSTEHLGKHILAVDPSSSVIIWKHTKLQSHDDDEILESETCYLHHTQQIKRIILT